MIKIHYIPPAHTAPLVDLPYDHPATIAPDTASPAFDTERTHFIQGSRSKLHLEAVGNKGRRRRNQRDTIKLSEEWQELAGKSGQFDGLLRNLHDASTALDKDGRPNMASLKKAQRELRAWFYEQTGGMRGEVDKGPSARDVQEQVAKVDALIGRMMRRNAPAGEGWKAEPGDRRGPVESPKEPALKKLRDFLLPTPKDATQLHQQGLKLWMAGKPDAALDALESAADKAPRNAQIQQDLGRLLAEEGYFAEAEWSLLQSATLKPRSAEVQTALGELYGQMDQPEMAAEAFRQAIQRDPNHTDAHTQLGVTFYEMGRTDEAAPHLQKAVSLDQQCIVARFYLAQVSLQHNDVLRARYQLNMVAKLDPTMDLERFINNEPPALVAQVARPEVLVYQWRLPKRPTQKLGR